VRVILADDHTMLREGLSRLLTSEGIDVVGQAKSGEEALALIEENRPDVAIVDVSMPEPDGIEVATRVAAGPSETKVLLLTVFDNPHTARRALRSGASGYLLKSSAFEDLVYAVNVVAGGGTYISPEIAGEVLSTSGDDVLTPREREVLLHIARGESNKEVAKSLGISVKTVETHRAALMRKLDLHNTAALVRYVLETGLEG